MSNKRTGMLWPTAMLVLVGVVAATASVALRAQAGGGTQAPAMQAPPARTLVTTTQINPDMLTAYRSSFRKKRFQPTRKPASRHSGRSHQRCSRARFYLCRGSTDHRLRAVRSRARVTSRDGT